MIFSRRAIQENISQLRECMDPSQVDGLVKRLNEAGRSRLSAMWEVVVIHSLTRLGNVECEQKLSSGKRPDILFTSDDGLSFYADVTCISDDGLDDDNPIEYFNKCLWKTVAKLGLPSGGHDLRVEKKDVKTSRGSKIVLRLPPSGKIESFISNHIEPEIERQRRSSERYIRISIDNDEAGVFLTLDKVGAQFNSMGYASYDKPTIIDRNPLFNALKSKAKQLKSAEGIKGIIVCDGDSQSLSGNSEYQYGDAHAICSSFLRQHRSIDFVIILSVREVRPNPLRMQLVNRFMTARMASQIGFERADDIAKVFDLALRRFPLPVNSPANAKYRASEVGYGIGNRGGYSMSGNKLKVSLREVVDVLAGRKSIEAFNLEHQWNKESGNLIIKNPFEQNLMQGRLPVKVVIEPDGDSDDDWIEFEFGGRDVAVSKFY